MAPFATAGATSKLGSNQQNLSNSDHLILNDTQPRFTTRTT